MIRQRLLPGRFLIFALNANRLFDDLGYFVGSDAIGDGILDDPLGNRGWHT